MTFIDLDPDEYSRYEEEIAEAVKCGSQAAEEGRLAAEQDALWRRRLNLVAPRRHGLAPSHRDAAPAPPAPITRVFETP